MRFIRLVMILLFMWAGGFGVAAQIEEKESEKTERERFDDTLMVFKRMLVGVLDQHDKAMNEANEREREFKDKVQDLEFRAQVLRAEVQKLEEKLKEAEMNINNTEMLRQEIAINPRLKRYFMELEGGRIVPTGHRTLGQKVFGVKDK